jgi:hypothetical protein
MEFHDGFLRDKLIYVCAHLPECQDVSQPRNFNFPYGIYRLEGETRYTRMHTYTHTVYHTGG